MTENIVIEQQTILPFEVGEQYFFRTVTYFLTGKVEKITGKFLTLSSAAWIPETGRFNECFKKGDFEEIELVAVNAILNTDSIVDAFPWTHKLPNRNK